MLVPQEQSRVGHIAVVALTSKVPPPNGLAASRVYGWIQHVDRRTFLLPRPASRPNDQRPSRTSSRKAMSKIGDPQKYLRKFACLTRAISEDDSEGPREMVN